MRRRKTEFAKPGLAEPGDPSAQQIIKAHCVECHNADGGDMEEIPYAATADGEPEYKLVMATAKPEITVQESGLQTVVIKPISESKLVHVTHIHILTMPIFTFVVGVLFLMTGIPQSIKLLIGPLPMLAVLLDISGWWIARYCRTLHLRDWRGRRLVRRHVRPADSLRPGIHVAGEEDGVR